MTMMNINIITHSYIPGPREKTQRWSDKPVRGRPVRKQSKWLLRGVLTVLTAVYSDTKIQLVSVSQ